MYVCKDVWVYVCMYVWVYGCMYVCRYVYKVDSSLNKNKSNEHKDIEIGNPHVCNCACVYVVLLVLKLHCLMSVIVHVYM